ncbi:MAG TPA: alpha/beta fold hydrolase [Candidatus Binatia bacterium]|nr:alpha/beta fold hydrolase [Candidatus Binatia bacterium]
MFPGKRLVPAPHGQLEAIYRPPPAPAERIALVLHPHPLYGGTMHNPVVFHAARALQESGFTTLRINFRGVGESTGRYDDGRGEVEDARAALDFLAAEQPSAREVLVAGFSFGALVGLRFGCGDARVHRLIAIGAPIAMSNASFLATCAKPKLFVHGDRDDVVPLAGVRRALAGDAAPPYELRVIPGATHFFETGMDELRAAIAEFVAC